MIRRLLKLFGIKTETCFICGGFGTNEDGLTCVNCNSKGWNIVKKDSQEIE